jgi:hypothetical protein
MFMLERYRLGELSPADISAVEDALATDGSLRDILNTLDTSDLELRSSYPKEYFKLETCRTRELSFSGVKFKRAGKLLAGIAAAAALCVLLPALYHLRESPVSAVESYGSSWDKSRDESQERAKGSAPAGSELSLFLKEDREIPLQDKAVLHEGSTVQLSYTAPLGECYGVIFSIDGRSLVTMHYPYRQEQSSLLVSGRRTFLEEAYTLDDAPDYELFVMVVSAEPLDATKVIRQAEKIAETSDVRSIEEKSNTAFSPCEVKTLKVLKQ